MSQFASKSVIVTGAGSGIGRAAAKRFAAEGAKVCVADLDGESAQRVAKDIVAKGGEAFACRVDVAEEADNERMVGETVKRYGGLDIAFLNAGYGGWEMDILNGDMAQFDRVLNINLRGCFLGIRSVNKVIRPGGAIVITASTASMVGTGFNPAYGASKHGVVGLVRSTAEAFAAKRVRINAICPGGVSTGMTNDVLPDLDVSPDDLPHVPFMAKANPEHIAEVALFLASNRAANVTGTAMVVDGGLTCSFASFTSK